MNRFEQIKSEEALVEAGRGLARLAARRPEQVAKEDLERLKVWGIAWRPRTPGYFMMRVRVPAGQLTADQARSVAGVAERHGRGVIDLTARGQLQLRWLSLSALPPVIDELRAAGLISAKTLMDSVRNISGCPLAGLCPHELFDATQTVRQIDEAVVRRNDLLNLPRKVNIAVTACTRRCCYADMQDIALVAAIADDDGDAVHGFNMLVGGKMSADDFHVAQPLDVFVTPTQAPSAVAALLSLYRDHGPRRTRSRSRLCYLVERWGASRLRQELERAVGRSLRPAGRDTRGAEPCRVFGVIPQRQPDRVAVTLLVRGGGLSAQHLHELAKIADRYGQGVLRFTLEKNVLLPGIDAAHLSRLRQEPLLNELPIEAHPLEWQTVSCTGAEFCALAAIETRQRSADISRELARRCPDAPPRSIHWSACRAGCGQHLIADIGLVGRRQHTDRGVVETADIYIGGSDRDRPRPAIKLFDGVPCDELVDTLVSLVRHWDDAVRRRDRRGVDGLPLPVLHRSETPDA